MRIVLVRHGQPEWVRADRTVRDPDLTRTGLLQAERTAHRLATDERVEEFLVSPLRRARQTSAPLEPLVAAAPRVHDFLEEVRPPDWDGHPAEEVRNRLADQRRGGLAAMWEGLPGGESLRDFHDRIAGGWAAWLSDRGVDRREDGLWAVDPDAGSVVVVAHAGTNAATVSWLLGVPPSPYDWERFVTRHASVTILEPVAVGDAHAWSLRRLNCVEHLPDGLTTE